MHAHPRLSAPDIGRLLATRRYDQLRHGLVELEPADVADLVDGLEGDQAAVVFRLLPRDLAAETFSYLDADQQQDLIAHLGTERLVSLINEMEPDDRTALLEELPAEVAQRLIALLTPEERRVTQADSRLPGGEHRPPDDAGLCPRARPSTRSPRRWTTSVATVATPKRST